MRGRRGAGDQRGLGAALAALQRRRRPLHGPARRPSRSDRPAGGRAVPVASSCAGASRTTARRRRAGSHRAAARCCARRASPRSGSARRRTRPAFRSPPAATSFRARASPSCSACTRSRTATRRWSSPRPRACSSERAAVCGARSSAACARAWGYRPAHGTGDRFRPERHLAEVRWITASRAAAPSRRARRRWRDRAGSRTWPLARRSRPRSFRRTPARTSAGALRRPRRCGSRAPSRC